jgi:SAM-dependent methyltransferase
VSEKMINQKQSANHAEQVYQAHIAHDQESLAHADETFKHRSDDGSIDWWRHKRLWEPVFKCLAHTKQQTWLTVGDTYGSDAFQMMREGFKHVLPTSIDSLMLEDAKKRGLIENYSLQNAEALEFDDNSFDYVLCREAYHHFPRPMIALYEMLRVARKAVVLIEPQDPMIDHPAYIGTIPAGYEASANYVYTLSRRELTKVALGLNLHVLACRGVFDNYQDDIARERAQDENPNFVKYRQEIERVEQECSRNLRKHSYLLAIIYKGRPADVRVENFSNDWSVTYFPENPYLASY